MLDFIINPLARSGRGDDIWKKIEPMLKEAGVPYHAYMTEYHRHAISLTKELCAAQKAAGADSPRIIAVGGDGTLDEVLNGLPLADMPILGYIPAGSGEDFIRGLGLASAPEQAMGRVICPSRLRPLDAGMMICGEERLSRRFIVSCGAGFDAATCYSINRSGAKTFLAKLHLSKLVYTLIGAREAFSYKKASGTLTWDGDNTIRLKNIAFISCHNLPYEGGGWKFAPGAKPDDGRINLAIYTARSPLIFALELIAGKLGLQRFCRGVRQISCATASLKLDTPLITHADGEIVGKFMNFEFCCLPACLQLME